MLRRPQLLLTLPLLAVALLLSTTSAATAVQRQVALSTYIHDNDGYVRASLKYDFKSRTSVSTVMNAWDVCPGDGHGARATLVVGYVGGGVQQRFAEDFTGCSNGGSGAVSYNFSGGGTRIEFVSFILEELDCDNGSCRVVHSRITGKIPNPYR